MSQLSKMGGEERETNKLMSGIDLFDLSYLSLSLSRYFLFFKEKKI